LTLRHASAGRPAASSTAARSIASSAAEFDTWAEFLPKPFRAEAIGRAVARATAAVHPDRS